MSKNQGGRPSKIHNFIPAMEKVLDHGMNAIICTDEELFILANELLEEEDKICYATFKVYKSKAKKGELTEEEKHVYEKFLALYKKAIIKQKESLFARMGTDNKARPRRAWIIERKFENWNLRHISENKHDVKGEISIVKIGK